MAYSVGKNRVTDLDLNKLGIRLKRIGKSCKSQIVTPEFPRYSTPGSLHLATTIPVDSPMFSAGSVMNLVIPVCSSSNRGESELQDRDYLLFIDWMNGEVSKGPDN